MSPANWKPPPAVSPRRLRPRRRPASSTPSIQTPLAATSKHPERSSSIESPIQPVYQLISSELMAMAKRADEEFGSNGDLGGTRTSSIAFSGSPTFERGRFYELYSARRNERLKRKQEEIAQETIAQDPGIAVELSMRRNSKKVDDGMRKSVPAERPKRKQWEIAKETIAQDPGIAVELSKRRNSKKVDSMRKSMPAERLKRKQEEIARETIAQDPGIAVELSKRRNSKKFDGMRKSVSTDFSSSRMSSPRSSVRSSKETKKPSGLTFPDKPAASARRIGTRSSARKL